MSAPRAFLSVERQRLSHPAAAPAPPAPRAGPPLPPSPKSAPVRPGRARCTVSGPQQTHQRGRYCPAHCKQQHRVHSCARPPPPTSLPKRRWNGPPAARRGGWPRAHPEPPGLRARRTAGSRSAGGPRPPPDGAPWSGHPAMPRPGARSHTRNERERWTPAPPPASFGPKALAQAVIEVGADGGRGRWVGFGRVCAPAAPPAPAAPAARPRARRRRGVARTRCAPAPALPRHTRRQTPHS